MPTKGVAVSQIILLVLGILVLAVVAYLLYQNFIVTGGQISAQQCTSYAISACSLCVIASPGATTCVFGVSSDPAKPTNLQKCQTQGDLKTSTTNTIDCTSYIGGGSGGAGTTTTPSTTPATTPPSSPAPAVK